MTTNTNNIIPLNLHPITCNRLTKLYIPASTNTDGKYHSFRFPNNNLDIGLLKEPAKLKHIFINEQDNGYVEVLWFANDKTKYQSAETIELFNQIIDLIPASMSWAKLISPNKSKAQKDKNEYIRNVFEHDISRIVHSVPFRKLQNKTQVIPLSDNDLVHNRLTHSIEVSAVGRRMAREIADYAWENYVDLDDHSLIAETFRSGGHESTKEIFMNNVADIVSAACLIHDIGNPPFGHQGEAALQETYDDLIRLPEYSATLGKLTTVQPNIFKIEGNAQTIRLLAENKNINLTYATLATSIKYPRTYNKANSIYKKFNIYESELELFNNILKNCGIPLANESDYSRHPLVYLVEAADDICYSLFDFEDFVHLEFISEDNYINILIEFILPNMISPKAKKVKGETIEDKRANYKQYILASDTNFANITSLLRTEAMNQLILNATYAFKEKYEFILSGVYTRQNGLLNAKGKINGLLDIYEQIMLKRPLNDTFSNSNDKLKSHSVISGYNNMNVLKNSLGGYEVMSELLKTLIVALHNLHKLKSQMVLSSIPENYLLNEIKLVLQKRNCVSWADALSDDQQIKQIRLLNDYLTGLTDNAALSLFKHIKAHEQITFA